MSSYKIYEWNTYLFPNTVNPVPMIFIKEELPNVVELDLTIQNTSSEYDGPYRGTVLNKKIRGYTVVVLNSKWYGYPDLGEMVISKKAHQFIQSDKMDEEEMVADSKQEKLFNKWLGGIIIGLFIIILIISMLR
jgi:hypothetical protein